MLKAPAPFPFPGAAAFVAPDATPVRIIQRNRDGSLLVHRHDTPLWDRTASSTLTVALADLFETAAEALEQTKGARRARKPYARRPRAPIAA